MHSLPVFLRLADRPVILLGDGDGAAAKQRLLERAGAQVVGEEAAAALAIVAIEDEDAALAAVTRLKARGILVNAVDRPEACDFTLPAIVDRDPVLIAIGTGGISAGLAKALRQRIEVLLPASLGLLAEALHAARTGLKMRYPAAADRRRAIDAALAPGAILDPLQPQTSASVDSWLATDTAPIEHMVYFIHLRSADPEDLTLGEARTLASADRVYHDGTVPASILDRARADAGRYEGPVPDHHEDGLTVFISRGE